MADGRYSIALLLRAERIIAVQLVDHAAALGDQGRPTGGCHACGRLPAGLTLAVHQARPKAHGLLQAGLMGEGSGT